MKKLYFLFSLLMATVIGLSSCESDDSLTNEPPAQEYIDKAKEILVGDLVLSTRATMSGVDKTLLESGCPTKFNFSWREDGTMVLDLSDFTVGPCPSPSPSAVQRSLCNSTVGKRMNTPAAVG